MGTFQTFHDPAPERLDTGEFLNAACIARLSGVTNTSFSYEMTSNGVVHPFDQRDANGVIHYYEDLRDDPVGAALAAALEVLVPQVVPGKRNKTYKGSGVVGLKRVASGNYMWMFTFIPAASRVLEVQRIGYAYLSVRRHIVKGDPSWRR